TSHPATNSPTQNPSANIRMTRVATLLENSQKRKRIAIVAVFCTTKMTTSSVSKISRTSLILANIGGTSANAVVSFTTLFLVYHISRGRDNRLPKVRAELCNLE